MASSCALSFIVRSPLPVLPKPHCAGNVGILRMLVANAQQKNNLCPGLCVVEAVARTSIDTQFPHPIATESVVAEVALFEPVEALEPFENRVFVFRSKIVANFVHN